MPGMGEGKGYPLQYSGLENSMESWNSLFHWFKIGIQFLCILYSVILFHWFKIGVQFHSFTHSCPVFRTLFIEETTLSPLYILGSSFSSWLHVCGVYLWVAYSIPLV